MIKRVIPHCTGSYTGEFCPTVRGPWARYYDDDGKFIDIGEVEPMPVAPSPLERIAVALEHFMARPHAPALSA